MITLSTNSDGKNIEGIGAMVQAQLACYVVAKHKNIGFCFNQFENFTHYQNYSSQEEFMSTINDFFRFPSDITNVTSKISIKNVDQISKITDKNAILEIDNRGVIRYFVEKNLIKYAEKESLIRNIRPKLDAGLFISDTNKKDIALHIRKYTKTDCCNSPKRDLFTPDKQTYYVNLIESLSRKYQNDCAEIKIIAQGSESDYQFFEAAKLADNHKITYFIEEHPIISLQRMINSNVLVMSNSSFSWISHLYGSHELVCKKSSWNHPMYSTNVVTIEKNGKIT